MRTMESIEVKSEVESTLPADQIILSRDVIARLLDATITMQGDSAAQSACSVGDSIEDSLVYDRAGWGQSICELMNHHSAILILYSGEMCQQQHEELIRYDELLVSHSEQINLFVITPDRVSASSCAAQSIMEDEPIFDDKSNLIFDMEVDADDAIEEDVDVDVAHRYKIVSDKDCNFAKKHRLCYSLSDNLCDIYESELGEVVDRQMILPAVYVVNSDGVICYSHLNGNRYIRPEPENVVECYKRLTAEM